jgi:hypothetical protein
MAYTIRKIKTRYGTEYGVYDRGSLVRTEGTKAAAKATAAYYRKAEKGNPAYRDRYNPGKPKWPKLGQWIKAHRVRIVKKNGAKVLEIQRTVPKRKNAAKRKARK